MSSDVLNNFEDGVFSIILHLNRASSVLKAAGF